jgi:hypothetical protein
MLGDEQVLAWMYGLFYKRLVRYGKSITENELVVDTANRNVLSPCCFLHAKTRI